MPETLRPVGAEAFAQVMLQFAPFEPQPVVAVALSGGPDSLALLLLLDRWAREQGGKAVALTVDHGLRPDSASEAAQVARWAAARGIHHTVLVWAGEKPRSGIQAGARAARYELLARACAERGILHLAVAHHADDQAETVLFRIERGSTATGLAGMASMRSLGPVRLIRPLLAWPKSRLVDTCADFGQAFVEDPSNRTDRYARTGLRARLAAAPDRRAALLEQARSAAVLRSGHDRALSVLLGQAVELLPEGIALLDPEAWARARPDLRSAALSAILRTVGGQAFAPESGSVERLSDRLQQAGFAGGSLAGCVVRSWRGRILVCREPDRAGPPVPLAAGEWHRWDGRFLLQTDAEGLTAGALGPRDYAQLRRSYDIRLPAIVGAGLPALRFGDRLMAVPAIGWAEKCVSRVEQRYLPLWPLSPETFTVVYAGPDIMSV